MNNFMKKIGYDYLFKNFLIIKYLWLIAIYPIIIL